MKNKMMKRLSVALAASAALAAAPAGALTINLFDVGGVTGTPAELGFTIAAKYWESVFTNDAILNFAVGYAPLGPKILGSTSSNLVQYVPIADYQSALAFTGTSALDATAVANLAPLSGTGSVKMMVASYLDPSTNSGIDADGPGRLAPDGMEISQTIALTTANVKALVGGGANVLDGEITFSSDFAFDFDPTNGIKTGTYDFVGVAIHEIGHALGFVSGADDFDYSHGYTGNDVDSAWWAYGLDMFRYAKDANGDPILNVVPGDDGYFSIDGGASAYLGAYFSTGTDHGDGWQASHWKEPNVPCTNFVGIMNPYICNGVGDDVTAADLGLFDAIGWNLADGARDNAFYKMSTADIFSSLMPVPELSTWAQMVLGFSLLGAGLRRRAKVSVRFG